MLWHCRGPTRWNGGWTGEADWWVVVVVVVVVGGGVPPFFVPKIRKRLTLGDWKLERWLVSLIHPWAKNIWELLVSPTFLFFAGPVVVRLSHGVPVAPSVLTSARQQLELLREHIPGGTSAASIFSLLLEQHHPKHGMCPFFTSWHPWHHEEPPFFYWQHWPFLGRLGSSTQIARKSVGPNEPCQKCTKSSCYCTATAASVGEPGKDVLFFFSDMSVHLGWFAASYWSALATSAIRYQHVRIPINQLIN